MIHANRVWRFQSNLWDEQQCNENEDLYWNTIDLIGAKLCMVISYEGKIKSKKKVKERYLYIDDTERSGENFLTSQPLTLIGSNDFSCLRQFVLAIQSRTYRNAVFNLSGSWKGQYDQVSRLWPTMFALRVLQKLEN